MLDAQVTKSLTSVAVSKCSFLSFAESLCVVYQNQQLSALYVWINERVLLIVKFFKLSPFCGDITTRFLLLLCKIGPNVFRHDFLNIF